MSSSSSSSSALIMTAIENAAKDAIKRFVKSNNNNRIIGLGSGSTTAALVREMAKLPNKEAIDFVTSSLQIKIEAEKSGLKIVDDENRIPEIDIVFDGADQIDSEFNMIKGGGGALLKEKILISASKKVVIIADSMKFVNKFNRPVPIEIHQFARSMIWKKLQEEKIGGGQPQLRTMEKGYPFVTENGNIILDTIFTSLIDVQKKEVELKSIPGVLEVGLLTKRADIYYKAKSDGSFEIVEFS
jgi:ribose 5-phosphate isomerase A